MIRRIVNWLFLLPLAVIIITLSVANRGRVTLSIDPVLREASTLTISVPLFIVVLGALFFGVILGGFVVWWGQRIYRKGARRAERDLALSRDEVERLRTQLAAFGNGSPRPEPAPPALFDRSVV